MRQGKVWLAAGLVTFVVVVVVSFPARVVYRFLSPADLAIGGIQGSIWNGSARELSIGGLYFSNPVWRFKPLGLFTGKLVYTIEAQPVSGFVETRIAVGIGGAVTLTDLTGSLPLAIVAAPARIAGLDGTATLRFQHLHIRDGLPVTADGIVEVNALIVPLIDRAPIGGYRAEFSTADNGIVASVEDTDGLFDVAGSLSVTADRSYRFLGQVAAKPETPEKLRRQMVALGSPNDRGQREVRFEGSL